MSTTTKNDRVFSLTQRPGEKTTDTNGLVDPRLFKGENKLHAVMDEQHCHWFMKYDKGAVPQPLQGRFTTFSLLKEAAEKYFHSRGVDIKELD